MRIAPEGDEKNRTEKEDCRYWINAYRKYIAGQMERLKTVRATKGADDKYELFARVNHKFSNLFDNLGGPDKPLSVDFLTSFAELQEETARVAHHARYSKTNAVANTIFTLGTGLFRKPGGRLNFYSEPESLKAYKMLEARFLKRDDSEAKSEHTVVSHLWLQFLATYRSLFNKSNIQAWVKDKVEQTVKPAASYNEYRAVSFDEHLPPQQPRRRV